MDDDDKQISTPDGADHPAEIGDWFGATAKNVQLNYGLMVLSIVFGITSIIAVILAYLNRGEATALVGNHYQYQIRTFWIGLLYSVISAILLVAVIGVPMLIATLIWFIVRNVKGFLAISKAQPIANPKSWIF